MRVLTQQDLLCLEHVLRIGDLLLLPRIRWPTLAESLVRSKFPIETEADLYSDQVQLAAYAECVYIQYRSEYQKNREEPSWINTLPLWLRMKLRHQYAIDTENPLAIVGELPFSGLWYLITEGALWEETVRIFNLWRLEGINQLGFLKTPSSGAAIQPGASVTKTNRYLHSLDVASLASLIGHNLGLADIDLIHLVVAGLTHDMCTPAGGDSVKWVDPKAFDEDANYRGGLDKLPREEWRDFRKRHQINLERLVETVLNQGLLGQILDISDKLAYVARDLSACVSLGDSSSVTGRYIGAEALREVLKEFPQVCNIWDSVVVQDGRLVFLYPYRLLAFLKVRATLFRVLYYHPNARVIETLVSQLLVKCLYKSGALDKETLLTMGDSELEVLLDRHYGRENMISVLSSGYNIKNFSSQEAAVEHQHDLQKKGRLALLTKYLSLQRIGADFLVQTGTGPRSLAEAYPADVAELNRIAGDQEAFFVISFADPLGEFEKHLADILSQMEN